MTPDKYQVHVHTMRRWLNGEVAGLHQAGAPGTYTGALYLRFDAQEDREDQ